MSDPKDFLTRWSRRKRQAAEDAAAGAQAVPDATNAPAEEAKEPDAFDPASLPPIDSLGPGSDIRAFLQKNVPADLTRAALRRVWSADPTIRNFVGLSENAWDFTAPNEILGFGPLEMSDEVRREIADIFVTQQNAARPAEPSPAADAPPPEQSEHDDMPAENPPAPSAVKTDTEDGSLQRDTQPPPGQMAAETQHEHAASQQDRPRLPRGHGRALPR